MPELAWNGERALIANRGPQVQAPDIFSQSCGPGLACRQCAPSQSPCEGAEGVARPWGCRVWRSGEKKT